MSWLVVFFDKEETVEAVPENWYISATRECFWPATNSVSKIANSIKYRETPSKQWQKFSARIMGSYDDLQTAKKKATKAQDSNDLSSNNESIGKGKRKKVRPRRYSSSSEDKETDSIDSDSPDEVINKCPVPPNVKDLCSNENSQLQHRHITDRDDSVSTPEGDGLCGQSGQLKSVLTATLHDGKVDEFQKQVVRNLNVIMAKLSVINETVGIILQNQNLNTTVKVRNNGEGPNIMLKFPVTEETLEELESWLHENDENNIVLAQELARVGGTTTKELTRKLMYRIFTNEVGMLYSWEGAKKKKCFKNLSVAHVILRAVRLNKQTANATETEIIDIIKLWLVRAKDRIANSNRASVAVEVKAVAN